MTNNSGELSVRYLSLWLALVTHTPESLANALPVGHNPVLALYCSTKLDAILVAGTACVESWERSDIAAAANALTNAGTDAEDLLGVVDGGCPLHMMLHVGFGLFGEVASVLLALDDNQT